MIGAHKYKINLTEMSQLNMGTGNMRQVRRHQEGRLTRSAVPAAPVAAIAKTKAAPAVPQCPRCQRRPVYQGPDVKGPSYYCGLTCKREADSAGWVNGVPTKQPPLPKKQQGPVNTSFTRCGNGARISANYVTKKGGVLTSTAGAVCGKWDITTGKHYAVYEILKSKRGRVLLGVCPEYARLDGGINMRAGIAGHVSGRLCQAPSGCTIELKDNPSNPGGSLHPVGWAGQQGFGQGDTVGLLVDRSLGTMTVFKNGTRLGVAGGIGGGKLFFGVGLSNTDDSVRITCAEPPE